MSNVSERWRWGLTAVVVALMVLIVLTFQKLSATNDATMLLDTAAEPAQAVVGSDAPTVTSTPPAQLAVDGIGAVRQPGVVYRQSPARVDDAVSAAGGLAPDADREQINLAAHVTDGEQIKVPRIGEGDPPAAPAGVADGDD